MQTETPTLETHIHGQGAPFIVSGDEQSIIDLAEAMRRQQRIEDAKYIVRHVVTAPARAVGFLAIGIGRAVAANVHEAWENAELRSHDNQYGTDLYARKQRKIIEARTAALVQKVGL
jgi:hypothetical protein